ncbi:hypothetical protein P3S68_029247 [Capsicum galapagoense]
MLSPKLESLEGWSCETLRNLMSPSVARGLLNLQTLSIKHCLSMEEVIDEEEQQAEEIMCNEPLFSQLEKLKFHNLPKLGHFILIKHAIEFPFLKEVDIHDCPEMKTFVKQGSVSTSSVKSVNNDDELKVVDLNKAMFNSKIHYSKISSVVICEKLEYTWLKVGEKCMRKVMFEYLASVTESVNNDDDEVSCPNLKEQELDGANCITALCLHQLSLGYFSKLEKLEVRRCGELRNLMSPSVARGLLNLRTLWIQDCQSMEEVITEEEEQQGDEVMCNEPLFPRLDELKLDDLPKLGHFIMVKSTIEVPFLKEVEIRKCPKMKTFVQQGSVSTPSLEIVNNDDEQKIVDLNNAMLNSKVCRLPLYNYMLYILISCPNLEELSIYDANNITALCSHQLPTAYFSKLKELDVWSCEKLRNLMSPSVARGLLNLRTLWIISCQSMEEVITEEEQQGEEIMTNEPLFS